MKKLILGIILSFSLGAVNASTYDVTSNEGVSSSVLVSDIDLKGGNSKASYTIIRVYDSSGNLVGFVILFPNGTVHYVPLQ